MYNSGPTNSASNLNVLNELTGGVLPSWMTHRKSKHHYARVLRAVAKRKKRNTTAAQRKAEKRKAETARMRDVMNDLGR